MARREDVELNDRRLSTDGASEDIRGRSEHSGERRDMVERTRRSDREVLVVLCSGRGWRTSEGEARWARSPPSPCFATNLDPEHTTNAPRQASPPTSNVEWRQAQPLDCDRPRKGEGGLLKAASGVTSRAREATKAVLPLEASDWSTCE